MQLTPSQSKALSTKRHLAITANAGSGKTRVLVHRYVKLFVDDSSLTTRNVVAITFTENAAAELRSRVAEEIAERLKALPPSERAERERLRRLRETLPNAYIGTIHGFASRMLRSYPVEANVDAAFTVVQGADQRILAEEAINRVFYSVLEEAYSQAPPPPVLRLFRAFGRMAVRNFIRALLQNRARALRVQKNILNKSDREIAAFWLSQVERALRLVHDPALPDRIRELYDFVKRVKSGKPGKPAQEFMAAAEAHDPAAPFFQAVTTFKAVCKRFLTGQNQLNRNVFDFESAPDLEERAADLLRAIVPVRPLLELCPATEADYTAQQMEYAAQLKTIWSLYEQVLEEYTLAKTQHGLLDFDDLIEGLLRLLDDAAVRQELSRQFRFIMVDEYQDTDESQLELVRRLTEGFGTRNTVAIVGDPKQAIYTFRNADAQIFAETMTAIAGQSLSEAAVEESL
ncbi:MAG: UvrD-helicase domain-containing protein, partial [Acidobacteriaceae bacterium]